MRKNILVIEDDPAIQELVVHYLKSQGFAVETARDGQRGLALARKGAADLVVLDLMLPEMDGIEVCKALRQDPKTAALPVLMLTAKGEETDKVVGLEIGADDYVTKPFSPKELMARIKALLRRTGRPAAEERTYNYGALVLDTSRHEIRWRGKEIELTAKEFGLLEALLKDKGRVLTRDALLNAVWGYDYVGETRTVDVHVRRLREKIPFLAEAIVTVKSMGYKLRDED